MSFVNLHRHDHHSYYDGYGTPDASAERAKELGQTALSLTNHGNMSGLVEHYLACKKLDIKPILGVEAYFQPEFNKENEYFHLTLLATSLKGYQTLSQLMTRANQPDRFFRHPICTFEDLEAMNDDVICLSGCIRGHIACCIANGDRVGALDSLERFHRIYGDRFYLEVMPHNILKQITINKTLIKLGQRKGIPVVLTLDSHYLAKRDYNTYLLMHKIKGREFDNDYSRLYMAAEQEIRDEWAEYVPDIDPSPFIEETVKITERCNVDLGFSELVPRIDWGMSSTRKLAELAKSGLVEKKLWTGPYKLRLREELDTVFSKKFEDYFLLCYDIVLFARTNGIGVGYGRGSVCGSLLAYSIGLTNVDPLVLGTSFTRFLRPDKNSLPDIDMDFDSKRRHEVFAYIQQRYLGRSAPIATYGYYKVKNLVNDLGKLLEMTKDEIELAKRSLAIMVKDEEERIDKRVLVTNKALAALEVHHKFVTHFANLYGQIRFIGRHAAGVAVTAEDIDRYVPLTRVHGELQTSYDLGSLSKLNIVKMDILGLSTVSVIREAEQLAGVRFNYDMLDDHEVYRAFTAQKTEGVFQFESAGARGVLGKVQPKNFQELVACNALNRPAPIQLGLLDAYVEGKNGKVDKTSPWYQYTQDTYGQIIYQEHVMTICRELAQMDWADVDKVMKQLRQVGQKGHDILEDKFVDGAMKHAGLKESVARDLYKKMTLYLFNKGHGCGYTLLSFYAMWLKIHFPLEYTFALLKHEDDDLKRRRYEALASKLGQIVLLPHVNGTAEYSIRVIDGERCIQSGLVNVESLGATIAQEIVRQGPYVSFDDFTTKLPKRIASVRVIKSLSEQGAVEFDFDKWLKRCERHNSMLYSRGVRIDD